MTDAEWDEQIDLMGKAHGHAMQAAALLTRGKIAEAYREAEVALLYEREAAQIGKQVTT